MAGDSGEIDPDGGRSARDGGGASRQGSAAARDRSGTLRRWTVRGLQLVLTVAVTWFIVDRIGVTAGDVSGLGVRWTRPDWPLFLAASLVLLGGYFLSAALWGRMVRDLGGPRLRPLDASSIYFASNLGRYLPGKVWQLAGLAYLARKLGVATSVATAAAVLVQAVSLAGATAVGAGALLAAPAVAGGWGRWLAGFIVVAVVVATLPGVFERLLGLWARIAEHAGGFVSGPPSTLARTAGGAGATAGVTAGATASGPSGPTAVGPRAAATGGSGGIRPGFGPRWVLLFAGNWLVYASAFWLLARSFGVEGSFAALGPAFAAAYVLGYVMVFAPAGIGVREGFLIALLQPTTGTAAATALAVIARLWMTVLELLPALAFGALHLLGSGNAFRKEEDVPGDGGAGREENGGTRDGSGRVGDVETPERAGQEDDVRTRDDVGTRDAVEGGDDVVDGVDGDDVRRGGPLRSGRREER